MATKKRNLVGEAAVELTTQQVAQALSIAGVSGYSGSADPSFVGAVLVALAVNTSAVSATLDSAKDRGRGGVGVMQH